MTKHPELFSALARDFELNEVKVLNKGGCKLSYTTARTVMNRLDTVLGPENWWDEYSPGAESVICRLTLRLPDGQVLTKCDAGGYAGMSDSGDDDKSGFSDAFKRAAFKFGVGRYLYRDGVPDYSDGEQPATAPKTNGTNGVPKTTQAPKQTPSKQANYDNSRIPPPGKAVYAWAKGMESHFKTSLVDGMKGRADALGYGKDFLGWDQTQVNTICTEVIDYIKTVPTYNGEFNDKPETPAPTKVADSPELAVAKKQVIAVATAIQKIREGREPTKDEIRSQIQEMSVAATNSEGNAGEEVGTLASCKDAAWVNNMHTEGLKYLKLLSTPATTAEDDNPF